MNLRPTEAACQQTVVEAAMSLGYRVHHARTAQNSSGVYRTPIAGHKGFPDLVIANFGKAWIVELKRKPNKIEPGQQQWIDALLAAGLDVRVVWVPDDMDAFIQELAAHRQLAMQKGSP